MQRCMRATQHETEQFLVHAAPAYQFEPLTVGCRPGC